MTTLMKAKQRKGKYLLWGRLPPAPAQREIQVRSILMKEITSIVQQYFLTLCLSQAHTLTNNVFLKADSPLTFACTWAWLSLPNISPGHLTANHRDHLSTPLSTRRTNPHYVIYGICVKQFIRQYGIRVCLHVLNIQLWRVTLNNSLFQV